MKNLWSKIVCFFKGHDDELWPHLDLIYLTKHQRSACKTKECKRCRRYLTVEIGPA